MTHDAGHASARLQAALDRHAGWQLEYDIALIVADRKQLLDQIKQLTERAERAEQTIANSAQIITARDARIRELEETADTIAAQRGEQRARADRLQRRLHEARLLADAATTYADWHLLAEHLRNTDESGKSDRRSENGAPETSLA